VKYITHTLRVSTLPIAAFKCYNRPDSQTNFIMMNLSSDKLREGAKYLGLELSPIQGDQFCTYYSHLVEANKHFNLTSIVEWEDVQTRHFLDSMSVSMALPARTLMTGSVADIGTGAGFPGVPLKIAFPGIKLCLIESVIKKAGFLRHIVEVLKLNDVEVYDQRAETLAHQPGLRESFDAVLCRGVAKLNVISELMLPFCKVSGSCVAQKQGDIEAELHESRPAFKILGGELREVIKVPSEISGKPRLLVVVNKNAPTPAKYPRRPGIPAKRPL